MKSFVLPAFASLFLLLAYDANASVIASPVANNVVNIAMVSVSGREVEPAIEASPFSMPEPSSLVMTFSMALLGLGVLAFSSDDLLP